MALAFVQKNTAQATGANALALGSSVGGAGSILVADVFWNNSSDLTSLADNKGNTWTPVGSRQSGSGGLAGYSILTYVCLAPAAGATTVTATPSTAVDVGLLIREYNGFTGMPAITGTPVYNAPTGTAVNSGDITTTVADAICISSCFPADACTDPIGGGYTTRAVGLFDSDPNWGGGDYADKIVTTIQTGLHCSYTITSSSINMIVNFAVGNASNVTNPKTLTASQAQAPSVPKAVNKILVP